MMHAIDENWHISSTLVSHNCHREEEVNTNWSHTSRFESPLVCYGCGERVPFLLESAFRMILEYVGKTPDKLHPPGTVRENWRD